jgi:H+-transporting ATPase
MAESNSAAAPALNTPIESHRFDEKKGPIEEDVPATKTKVEDDDDEDEDIDALIEDLESQDGHVEDEEEEDTTPGGARNIPEDQLQTDTRLGLTEQEVLNRRRKYGEVCLQR